MLDHFLIKEGPAFICESAQEWFGHFERPALNQQQVLLFFQDDYLPNSWFRMGHLPSCTIAQLFLWHLNFYSNHLRTFTEDEFPVAFADGKSTPIEWWIVKGRIACFSPFRLERRKKSLPPHLPELILNAQDFGKSGKKSVVQMVTSLVVPGLTYPASGPEKGPCAHPQKSLLWNLSNHRKLVPGSQHFRNLHTVRIRCQRYKSQEFLIDT